MEPMMKPLSRKIMKKASPYFLPDAIGRLLVRLFSGGLKRQLMGFVTDKFLEALLKGMDLAFWLSKGYRRNIENFEARYVFRSAQERVDATVDFKDGDMVVHEDALDDYHVRVTFRDPAALRSFLFSKNQDILDSLLKNEVSVEGNLNYIYKFGFMGRDLAHRLGVL
jgi:hypothetical protein